MLPTAPARPSKRLYDRHSASNMDDIYGGALNDARSDMSSLGRDSSSLASPLDPQREEVFLSARSHSSYPPNPLGTTSGGVPLIRRPTTPADEAISSADWSIRPKSNQPLTSPFPTQTLSISTGSSNVSGNSQLVPPLSSLQGPPQMGSSQSAPPLSQIQTTQGGPLPFTDPSAMKMPVANVPDMSDLNAFPSLSSSSSSLYPSLPADSLSRPKSTSSLGRPSSPGSPSISNRVPLLVMQGTHSGPGMYMHTPGPGSEFSDEDGSEQRRYTGHAPAHKEKGKIPESVDLDVLSGILEFC